MPETQTTDAGTTTQQQGTQQSTAGQAPPAAGQQQATQAPGAPNPADFDAAIRAHLAQQRGPGQGQPGQATPATPAAQNGTGGTQQQGQAPAEPGDAAAAKRIEDLPAEYGWARDEIKKANAEAAKYRTQVRDLQPLAEKGKQLEAASQSDMQRLEGRASTAEQERDSLRVENAQLRAATRHRIPDDLVPLLGAGTAEQIEANAELLAQRLAAAQPAAAQPPAATAPAGSRRPVESLRPGAAPGDGANREMTPDEWIRSAARRR